MTVTADPSAAFVGRAFGIELEADFCVPGLLQPGAASVGAPAQRRVRLRLTDTASSDAMWPGKDAERTFEIRASARRPLFTIDRHLDAGYRVWISGLGRCVVATNGREIVLAPPRGRNRWRLLFGQGLPIAAALQGLEVLHASAVVLDDRCLAFIADSGTGKTSLALHLLGHGARFLADDVVALEVDGERLVAQPGIPIGHVSGTEQSALERAGLSPRRPLRPDTKHHVSFDLPAGPVPLGAAYFLQRDDAVASPEVTPVDPPDARMLMRATFVSHVPVAARLITQLDICSRIARTVPIFTVRSPRAGDPADLAERIARHARKAL